jgi:hypothetical protein
MKRMKIMKKNDFESCLHVLHVLHGEALRASRQRPQTFLQFGPKRLRDADIRS